MSKINKEMIVITGAYGFIGSCMIQLLNELGIENIIAVDDFNRPEKATNLEHKKFDQKIDREEFVDYLNQNGNEISAIYHLGARTDTAEFDYEIFEKLNIQYTKDIWNACVKFQIPLLYASSAATYGDGELGFDDAHNIVDDLKPLNPYGESKNVVDQWILKQTEFPPFWAGVKFFNVYGPNESHKERMASVIFHTFRQIKKTGAMKLFQSHRPDFGDGEQSRDFVYVKDVVKMCHFLIDKQPQNGLYNIGTGKARSFKDLASNTFTAQGLEPDISFIPTPEDIRDKYQYFTEANMSKLEQAGYDLSSTHSLEDGIKDYVQNYLMKDVKW